MLLTFNTKGGDIMRFRKHSIVVASVLVVAILATAGCGTIQGWLGQKSVGQTLIVSGETIVFSSKQFEAAGKEFTARCAASAGAQRLSAAVCNSFDTFGVKFKEVWPPITAAWRSAVKFRDAALQGNMQKALSDLMAEMLGYLGKIGVSQSDAIRIVQSLFDGEPDLAPLRAVIVADLNTRVVEGTLDRSRLPVSAEIVHSR